MREVWFPITLYMLAVYGTVSFVADVVRLVW
jgi:hypothetical protein